MEGGISSSSSCKQHTCTSEKRATGSERSPGSQTFFCYVPFICTAQLSRGHKRRNNPISKLESSLTQQRKRKKRAWKKMRGGKKTTTESWRGQRWGAMQRVSLPTEHAQQVKRLKVKFEIRRQGSKGFFHKAKTMVFMLTAFHGHYCPVEERERWSGLVGTGGQPRSTHHTLHFHPLRGVQDLLGVSMW